MVKKNNRNDGDVKPFQKIIGIASLLKNEPSTSHRSENWPSLKSMLLQCWSNLACIHSTTSSKFQNHQSNSNNPQSKASSPVGSLSPQLLYPQQKTRNQHLKSAIWITQSTIKSIYPGWIVVSTVVVSTTQGSLAVGVHLAITFPGRARIVWAENWKIQVKGWQL